MIEANNPIDIGKDQIAKYKGQVEDFLAAFGYRREQHSLADLLRDLDPNEKYVMGNAERDTYLALREGLQVFTAINEQLSDKVGLKEVLIETPNDKLADNPELEGLRDFCHSYSAYAASLYISKKMDGIMRAEGYEEPQEEQDLSVLKLDGRGVDSVFLKQFLVPIYHSLVQQKEKGNAFSPSSFTNFVKDVFEKYAELAVKKKGVYSQYEKEALEGYTFRIMDDYVVLEGYENKTTSHVPVAEQEISFQPISPNEIVGNVAAKRKITRYMQRLALYDVVEQKNPILELGGLSWTNLFDGPPGTGKTSMFRMAMTLLRDYSEQVGVPFHIFSVDQSVKDEYYGKTGKKLLEKLEITKNPGLLALGIFDDIDLLTSTRHDAQGADNDINNILMQYLDGAFTVRRGNVINFAASNEPTGLDNAMRNRFNDRLLIDGPVTAEDFADITNLMGSKLLERGFLTMKQGYTPFKNQDQQAEDGSWSAENVADYMASEFTKYKKASVMDFGTFMAELKERNPRITGRSSNAIMEAIKERTADFDVPSEWFEERAHFLDLPFDGKIKKLAELYTKITPDVMFQEATRYFDSEQRYAEAEAERHIQDAENRIEWNLQGELNFVEHENELMRNGDVPLRVKLAMAQSEHHDLITKAQEKSKK